MPVYLNKDSGLAESVPSPGESHEIPLVSPDGVQGSAPASDVPDLIKQGYRQPNPQELQGLLKEAHFNEPMEQIKTGLEGAASGATFGLSSGIERAMGVAPEDINARREANPGVHGIGQGVGLVASSLTGVGEGAALAKIGTAAGEKIAAKMGTGALAKIAAAGGRGAIENALFSVGDEASKFITEDPTQSAETAISNVGLSAILGGGIGGTFGAIGSGLDAVKGKLSDGKMGQFVSDLKGRLNEHLNNPEPLQAVNQEIGDFYTGIRSMADDVYGPTGLKAQEIAKTMPEFNPKMVEQAASVSSNLEKRILEMEAKPNLYPERLTSKLRNDLDVLKQAAGSTDAPALFNAMQDLKQSLQSYSKFDKFVKPVDEAYDFVRASKELAHGTREALEDSSVWGKAAERQKSVNKAFTEFLPSLKDFESKFTAEVGGERVIDPGKLNTYMNQLGKPNAELKQEMMANFLEAADKYRTVIDDTHANLGLEAPSIPSNLTSVRSTLEQLTPGAKAADALLKTNLGEMLGTGIGGAVGGGWGAFVGAQAGKHADKTVKVLMKQLLSMTPSGAGFKSAMEMGANIIEGDKKINNVVKGVFGAAKTVLTEPSFKDLEKLQQRLDRVAQNPQELMDVGGQVGHYMPDHATAIGMTAARASSYLATLKPQNPQGAPLDAPMPLSKTQLANYTAALKIAQEPLSILEKVKNGTVTPMDLQHLNSLYPGLKQRLDYKLTEQLVDHLNKGQAIPYKTKLGMSLFMGQSLESSMKQPNLQSNQMTFMSAPPQQMPVSGPKPKNMNKLDKIGQQNQTTQQSRESYRSTGHR